MFKFGTLFWLALLSALGIATYEVKYAVQRLDHRLAAVASQTQAEHREIHVLNAEWAYLNQPERLAALNQRFLSLGPIASQQLSKSIADIPFRAPPPPGDAVPGDAVPGEAVADNAAPAAPGSPPHAIRAMVHPAVAVVTRPVRVEAALAVAGDRPETLNQLFAQIAEERR